MAVMDEFRAEREAIKSQPFKVRFSYFMDYYKWHVIGISVAVIALCAFIYHLATAKDFAMNAVLLGAYPLQEDTSLITQDYAQYAGINLDKEEVYFDSSLYIITEDNSSDPMSSATSMETTYNSAQILGARLAAKDLDILTMNPGNFTNYAYQEIFMDLRQVLTDEQLASLDGKLYYMDYAFLPELDAIRSKFDYDTPITYPVYDDPSALEEPVPVGINLAECSKFNEHFSYPGDKAFVGVAINTTRLDNAKAFLNYLFED